MTIYKKNKALYVFIICCMFFSCSQKQKGVEATYNIEYDDNDFVNVEKLVSEIKFIELDTIHDALIPDITDMYICNDRIYCFSNSQNGYICVFSMDGKFLFKIQHVGKADNEWIFLRAMSINENEGKMYLTDNWGRKILEYTLDGKFVKSYKIDMINNLENYHDGKYFYSITNPLQSLRKIDNNTDHLINILDKSMSHVGKMIDVTDNSSNIMEERNNRIYKGETGLLIAPTLSPTIYRIEDTREVPYINYKYKGNKMSFFSHDDYQEAADNNEFIGGRDEQFYSGSIVESDELIVRQIGYYNSMDVIYNKKTGKTITTKFNSNIQNEKHLSKYFMYRSPYFSYKGKYYAPFSTQLLGFQDTFTKGYIPKELKEIKQKVDKNAINNIIVEYKIKM